MAFLTAYYGLIACADVKAGEWVLIHGGAGGVGMAALQIAQWRGARVIVTAGAQEKRDLMIALGAEYAFDSRSGAFVDDVMRVTERSRRFGRPQFVGRSGDGAQHWPACSLSDASSSWANATISPTRR